MKTVSKLEVYEYSNGVDIIQKGLVVTAEVEVMSHWNDRDLVVLKVKTPNGDSFAFTVKEEELIKATSNASNV